MQHELLATNITSTGHSTTKSSEVCSNLTNDHRAIQICRCKHAWTMVLNYTPKHISAMMQKSSPKQGFCGILPQIWSPLLHMNLKNMSRFWQNHPLFFPEIWHLRPPESIPCFTCSTEKQKTKTKTKHKRTKKKPKQNKKQNQKTNKQTKKPFSQVAFLFCSHIMYTNLSQRPCRVNDSYLTCLFFAEIWYFSVQWNNVI